MLILLKQIKFMWSNNNKMIKKDMKKMTHISLEDYCSILRWYYLKDWMFFIEKIEGTLPWLPLIFKKYPLFIYNKLNKHQIKLLCVFINYNKVLGSIKNKKFLNLSDPLRNFNGQWILSVTNLDLLSANQVYFIY